MHTHTHTHTSLEPAYKKTGGLQLCSDYESLLTSPTHQLILNEAKDNARTHAHTRAHSYTQWSLSNDLNKFLQPPDPPRQKKTPHI